MKGKTRGSEPAIEVLLQYANSIIATLREPFLVLDKNLRVISANHAFCTAFKATEKSIIGRSLPSLGNGQWNIPELLQLLEKIIPDKKVVKDYEVEHEFEKLGLRAMILNACQLRVPKEVAAIITAGQSEKELILLAIEDVTERKLLQIGLKDSEERYRRAFETSRDGLLLIHKIKGDILNANESAQELLGYSHAELLKKKLWGIGLVKDGKEFEDTVVMLEKKGVIYYEDATVKTKKGLGINSEVFLVNKAKVIQCNIRDITTRRRAEEQERISAAYLSYLTKYANDFIILLDKDFRFLEVNERVIDVYGYTREELLKMSAAQFCAAETKNAFAQQINEAKVTGKALYETIHKRKDGTTFPVEISLRAIKVDDKVFYQAVIRDITERKKLEEELARARETQYRTLVENLPQKVYLKDINSTFVSCNENYAKDLKIRPEEIVGKTDYDFFPTHLAEKYKADDKRIMLSGKIENIEEEYMVITDFLRGAQKAIINTIKVPVLDKNGRVTGLFGIFWDITEQKRTQDALKESERKIRAVFDQTFQFMGLMTIEGDLIEANMAALDFAGVKKSDVINKPFWKTPWWTHSPELQEKLKEAIKVVAEGEFVRFDATHTAKDGSLHEVDFSLKPVRDETGKVVLIVPEGRDVTERNRAERELRESEKKFRSIFESMTDGMVLTDVDSRKFYMCNKSFSTMLGYSQEEISSLSIEDIHPQQDMPYVIDQFNGLVKGEISLAKNIPVKRKDGSIFYTDINVADSFIVVRDKPYLAGFFRDITEQKKAEAEREITLKWQKDVDTLQQQLLVPAALEGKLKTITDGITLIFGVDFCRIWLVRPGDMCEKGCIHAKITQGPHVCRDRDKCLHLMASSGRYTNTDGSHARVPFGCYKIGLVASGAEHKFLTNDVVNEPRVHDREWARGLGLVSFAGYQIKASEAQAIGVLALFARHPVSPAEDAMLDSIGTSIAFVVEQAIAEGERIRLLGVKASSEIKSKFTSTVSHELRSPMTVIKESINLILEGLAGDVTNEQKDILNTAKNNIDRLGRLINNVLDFQKIEAGKMDLDIKEYDLNEIVLATGREMYILAENKGLSFVVNIDEGITKINFDKDRIVQVLTNLLSNAIKFTEKGGIVVSTQRQDNTAHISVNDTGLGIPTEEIPKLFQAFEQLSSGIGRKRGGTGLGLAISKEIVLAHNGKIWADSRPGEGTTFHFTLPIKERRG